MKKLILLLSLLLLFILGACGDSETQSNGESEKSLSDEPKLMKIGSTVKSDIALGRAESKFAEIVEKETNGTIKVEVYHDSQLGGERDIMEGIQLGTIQAGAIGTSVVSNFSSRFDLWSLPFLFPDRETSHRILDGPIGQEVLDDLEDLGVIGFNYWESGIRNLTNSEKEIKLPEDLNGLKIRTMENEIQLDYWTALGAAPTPMAFPELFSGLQQGVVDGQENPFSVIASSKFYDVQKYLTETEHLTGVNAFIINKEFYESLTDQEKESIEKAATEAQAFQREEKGKEDEKYKEQLIEEGMQITTLTDEDREKWVEKVTPTYEKYKDTIDKDLVEQLLKEVNQN